MKVIKTIFFDRDGVINEVVKRGELVSSPRHYSELKIRDDFKSFCDVIRSCKLSLFVVSNQPDVSRNLLPQVELDKITAEISALADFREIVYCTHDDAHQCDCRKPKPGMIVRLLKKYDLNADTALIVGDSHKDILAGNAAGISTVYLTGGYNASVACNPDITIESLHEICHHYAIESLS